MNVCCLRTSSESTWFESRYAKINGHPSLKLSFSHLVGSNVREYPSLVQDLEANLGYLRDTGRPATSYRSSIWPGLRFELSYRALGAPQVYRNVGIYSQF